MAEFQDYLEADKEYGFGMTSGAYFKGVYKGYNSKTNTLLVETPVCRTIINNGAISSVDMEHEDATEV